MSALPRLPGSLRVRLTLLYGGCFLIAGAALLGITYALVANTETQPGNGLYFKGPRFLFSGNAFGNQSIALARNALPSAGIAAGPTTLRRIALPAHGHVQGRIPAPGKPLPVGLIRTFKQLGQKQVDHVVLRANRALSAQRSQSLAALLTESGIALAIMALVSILLGWLVAGRALRPLRTMNIRARQITEDTLHERLAEGTRDDELGELASAFDGVLGRLERAFASHRGFVANASHELRTPITLQRALVEVALADRNASREELRRTCKRVLAAGEQQERVIEALLTLARGQAGIEHRQPVDLAEAAGQLLEAREAQTRTLDVRAELGAAIVNGDEALLERLVANVLDNAIIHNARDGGWISVETSTQDGRALLRVANAGAEIPADLVDQLFEPFRRLDDERTACADGLGLGLSIISAIASAHGATVSARPLAPGGLELVVSFPAIDQVAASAPNLRAPAGNLA